MISLSATGIHRTFGALRAVNDVSIDVREGSVVGLIGPNGSGKTTLLNILSAIDTPDGGQVRLGDTDLTGRRAHHACACGLARTFQNIRLFGDLTAVENVEAALSARSAVAGRRGARRRLARALLTRMGIERYERTRASTLPYGTQRRLEIARSLATEPRFLLLDEPAAGLNEEESDGLLADLRSLREAEGIGLLVVDHDLRLIMRLCDRIVVLNEGKVISEGAPEAVRADPQVISAYLGEGDDAFATNRKDAS